MIVRTVKYELEARLKPITSGLYSKSSGKLERKTYGDMTERLKITIRKLKVPDDTLAIVTANGSEIATLPIKNGAGKFDEESGQTGMIQELKVNQTVNVIINDEIVLQGILYED